MTSRSLICALFCLLVFAGCKKEPTAAGGLTPVSLVTDWYPQPEHGGFYNALVRGYYKEAGLDVTIIPGGPNSLAGQQIAMGGKEFGLASSDDVSVQVEQGLPLIAVGPTLQHDPIAVMVHPESGIENFGQIEGKSIAVAPTAAWFLYLNKKYHWKDVRVAPLTFSVANYLTNPDYIQQIFITSEPFFVEKAGKTYRTLLPREAGFDPYRVFFTNKNLLQKNPKMVQAFVTASLRGWKDYMVDPSAANAEIQRLNPQMNAEKMAFSWKALADGKFVLGDKPEDFGKFDAARLANQYKILKDIGILRKDLGPEASYTTQFLGK